ncbi:MAG: hypothetical protein AAF489_16050 [Bacteroidota bacterium]
MKTNSLLFIFLLTFSICQAQSIDFVLADPQPDLIDVNGGSFASSNIDTDGD